METRHRTPEVSLREVFLRATEGLPGVAGRDYRGAVVAEALGYLQEGFGAHYATQQAASDDAILVGDHAYALAVETIARLDEPRFVGVASRMIRDGAGEISRGNSVAISLWTPHLAQLLGIISGEGEERSKERIKDAIVEVTDDAQ
ncbi:MAG: Superfamily II RNA helicase [uncultured Rubrobacteraceae bacterium]|uniref:Superfamily II RNA helicase n=1 Tax=uncultured Rubrobacteraceae bacterium TaxID=349277 RepID=A0A6J4R0W6_9ACTN|nr:MAG: Superfamily II RNA helicase [uncultured Rubrobacteraceae bacterium]